MASRASPVRRVTASVPDPVSTSPSRAVGRVASRVDAHQHFWGYNPMEYAWIADTVLDDLAKAHATQPATSMSMHAIARDFLPHDLAPLLTASGIQHSIAVEARQSLSETRWLLSLADQDAGNAPAETPSIVGVVGWAPLAAPDFAETLATLLEQPKLVGLRHGVQSEPDPLFLRNDAFNAGVAQLATTSTTKHPPLAFDLLVLAHQLEETLRFVDRHPHQSFILDHCAKPPIAAAAASPHAATAILQPWLAQFRALARRPNVACKLSGLVTEAAWHHWTPADLDPIWRAALEAFGPHRLLFGSDWPVATLAAPYAQWVQQVETWVAPLSADEQAAIWFGNAVRLYQLPL
jgi:L-fuconolactonase